MNKEQTKEMIKVMQAYVDGAEIEYLGPHENWIHADEPGWNFQRITYRIKPKPVEYYVLVNAKGEAIGVSNHKSYVCYKDGADIDGAKIITVREVV